MSPSSVVLAEVGKLIEDCISRQGVHVIDLEMRGEGKGKSLEVFIDSEQGITSGDCSSVSREIDRLMDSTGFVREPYRLTVSSPGVGRPLKFPWQYRKHVGRQLDLKVRSQEGTRNVAGELLSMDDTGIVIGPGKGGEPETLTFDGIVEARVKAPW